jgi:hypothetical protein
LKLLRPVVTSVLALLAIAPTARAQTFGQFGGADALPVNARLFGGYLHANDAVVGALAQLRLSFYPGVDFGFQGGLARTDAPGGDKTTLRIGGDVKGQVASAAESGVADMAVGGHLGIDIGDGYNVLRLGPTLFASRVLPLGEGGGVVPYGSLGLTFSRLSVGDFDDSDFSFPLRLGTEFRVNPAFRFLAELQVNISDQADDDLGIAAGVNLPF